MAAAFDATAIEFSPLNTHDRVQVFVDGVESGTAYRADGKVTRVGFSYLDGEQSQATTFRFYNPSMSFIEGFYDDSTPIEMTALDDSGAETTIIVPWPEGEQ